MAVENYSCETQCFLYNHMQLVTANDNKSPSDKTTSGLLQASVSGPLVFVIYAKNLPSNISSEEKVLENHCVIHLR